MIVKNSKPKHVVMLDPGHGSTPGARGFDPGVVYGVRTEAEANLEACLTIKHLLVQMGVEVHLTHDGRQGAKPDLYGRIVRAKEVKADAFISIHYDMVTTPPRHLSGVYYAPGVSSYQLAKEIIKVMRPGAWLKPSNSSRFGGLYIDSFPDALPSILIELDSIAFAPGKLDGQARTKMLQPIARVIHSYLS
jgi:N-acetylmuramoyl-L-alanine amidase